MPFQFSDHARKQLKRRKLSTKQVLGAAGNPAEIIPSFRGRKLRRKRVGSKLLEVVTKAEGSMVTIITAYYLEE